MNINIQVFLCFRLLKTAASELIVYMYECLENLEVPLSWYTDEEEEEEDDEKGFTMLACAT